MLSGFSLGRSGPNFPLHPATGHFIGSAICISSPRPADPGSDDFTVRDLIVIGFFVGTLPAHSLITPAATIANTNWHWDSTTRFGLALILGDYFVNTKWFTSVFVFVHRNPQNENMTSAQCSQSGRPIKTAITKAAVTTPIRAKFALRITGSMFSMLHTWRTPALPAGIAATAFCP